MPALLALSHSLMITVFVLELVPLALFLTIGVSSVLAPLYCVQLRCPVYWRLLGCVESAAHCCCVVLYLTLRCQ